MAPRGPGIAGQLAAGGLGSPGMRVAPAFPAAAAIEEEGLTPTPGRRGGLERITVDPQSYAVRNFDERESNSRSARWGATGKVPVAVRAAANRPFHDPEKPDGPFSLRENERLGEVDYDKDGRRVAPGGARGDGDAGGLPDDDVEGGNDVSGSAVRGGQDNVWDDYGEGGGGALMDRGVRAPAAADDGGEDSVEFNPLHKPPSNP